MPPNNKKQRGRRDKQKKKEAQNALFGTPAIDECINELAARSVSITAKASSSSAAVVSKSSASSSTTQTNDAMICYHESSAEHFVVGSPFLDMVKSFVSLNKKPYDDVQWNDASTKFYNDKENQQILLDYEFTKFVFALGVSLYLKVPSEDKEKYHRLQTLNGCAAMMEGKKTLSFELEIILQLGLNLKYNAIPHKTGKKTVDDKKLYKYLRDSESDRGIINCLYRETYCDCMEMKKSEANDMDKMDRCRGCRKVFPKAKNKLCDGCEAVVYCSNKCAIADWPVHKLLCTREQEKVANKRKKNDKTKKNMAAATTGTATSNANGSMSTPTTQSISNPNLGSTSGGGNIGDAVLGPSGANKPVPTTAKPKNLPATHMAAATTGTATSNANGSMSTPTTQSISNPNLGSTSGGGNIGDAVLGPSGAKKRKKRRKKTVPTTAKPKNLLAATVIYVIALAGASYLRLGAPATVAGAIIFSFFTHTIINRH